MSGMNGEGEAAQSSWQRPDAPLGTLIFREGLLSAEQLEEALGESVKRGKRLGQVLVERGLLEESQVARILARQKGLEYVDLRETVVDPAAASLLSSEIAWLAHAVPIAVIDGTPFVAVEDPGDEDALRRVAEALGAQPRFAVATRSEILRVLGTVFEGGVGSLAAATSVVAQPVPAVQVAPDPTPVAPLQQPAAPPPQPVVAEANGLRVAAPPPEQPAELAPEPAADLAPEPPVQVAPVPAPFEPEPVPAAPEQVPAVESVPVVTAVPDPAPPVQVWPEAEAAPEPAPVEPAPAVETAPVAEPQPVAAFEQPAAPIEPPPAPMVEAQPEPEPTVQQPPALEEVPEQAPAPASPAPAFPEEPAAPAPTVVDFPPPAPPAAEPPAAPVPPPLEVVPPAFEPWPEPAPAAEAPVAPEVAESAEVAPAGTYRVVARLADGSEIEVDVFPTREEAKGAAKLLSRQIGAAAPGEWPELGGRFVRPDLIVSVDLL